MHVDIGQGSRGDRYEKSQVKEGGEGRKRRRGGGGGGRDTTGKRNLRDRRCRDTAGRAVNYKRSAKPLWSSLGGAGVSRRIDNTEFVRGRRNLDGPWFIQPPEPASQPASQPANRARLDTSTMLRFSRCLSSSFYARRACPCPARRYRPTYILSRSSSHPATNARAYLYAPQPDFPSFSRRTGSPTLPPSPREMQILNSIVGS